MGSDPRQDEQARKEEQPQFTCHLIQQSYRVSRYPVTVAQYRLFIEDEGYANPAYWDAAIQAGAWKDGQGQVYSFRRNESGTSDYIRIWTDGPEDYGAPFTLDNHPQVGVSWYEATAYCAAPSVSGTIQSTGTTIGGFVWWFPASESLPSELSALCRRDGVEGVWTTTARKGAKNAKGETPGVFFRVFRVLSCSS